MSEGKRRYRSAEWFGKNDKDGFVHRSWMRNQGIPSHMFDGRPVIGICNTWSELTPCNAHFRTIAEHVRRGVLEAGGFPLEFPVTSLGESNIRPTAMFLRNLASMDVEESIRANPIDAVVLLCGCDKTTPSLVMGAASVDLPTIVISGGPMLNGKYRGRDIGSGTAVWQLSEQVKSGEISVADFMEAEAGQSRSAGHCMTMGTASTMASMVEALGIALPTNAAIPAVDSRRLVLANAVGRRIVAMAEEDLRLSKVLTREAFENAIRVNGAIGGSTNAVVHLAAIYRRLGRRLDMAEFDRIGQEVPVLVDLKPAGTGYMGDFHNAGGVPRLLSELTDLIDLTAPRAFGGTLGETMGELPQRHEDRIIRPRADPISASGGIAVLTGNLAPRGAVIKHSSASPGLQTHEGRAVVFDSVKDLTERLDDPTLEITADDVLVLRNAGPKGAPGMPEAGYMPIPRHLARQGVKDMVRISDARMSGTAFGSIVLHITPEAADGGPLAAVRTGDRIRLDVPNRRLELLVSAEDLADRMTALPPPPPTPARGYARLYDLHVMQADDGLDFDFLMADPDA